MGSLQLQKVLGSGAFGTVYKGTMEEHGNVKTVAIKVMSKEGASNERFLRRLRDEAKLLTLLNTSLIIKVLGSCSIRGLDAVILEYVDGIDMHKLYCSSIHIPMPITAFLGAKIAEGLHMAHTAINPKTNTPLSVIHRDIKPGNIMITREGAVKLCDFGIAKAVFETRESYTSPQEVLGTKDYIAPEYIIQGRITPAADVYAMGLSLLQLLIKGNIGTLQLNQRAHEKRIYNLLRRLPPDFRSISNLLAQMLTWDPQQRPTAYECAQQLYSIAQKNNGPSFQEWSRRWITQIMSQLPPPKDQLQLLGITVPIQETLAIQDQRSAPDSTFSLPPANQVPVAYVYIFSGVLLGVFMFSLIFSVLFSISS